MSRIDELESRIKKLEYHIQHCKLTLISDWKDSNFDDFINGVLSQLAEMEHTLTQIQEDLYGRKKY